MYRGDGLLGEIRARRHQRHWNRPVDPQGYTGTVPCAEGLATAQARKGANRAPVWATVWSSETQMGRPSHGRRNARRATTPTTLGPKGAVRHTSKLATDAGQEEAFEGGRAAAQLTLMA